MKIIGYTVGTTLPKPNLAQTDPQKGDYVKGKEILDEKYIKVDEQELTDEQKAQVRANIGLDNFLAKDEITKTDLSADVQASLDKADAAENVYETKSDAEDKLADANTYTDSKVGALGALAKKSTVVKTDLEESVQDSLDKADSALQSYTETDPTVPAWAKEANKPTYTASEVGLGNVNNTSDVNKPVSAAQAAAIADAKKAGTDAQDDIDAHAANKSNPHGVTAAQVGAEAKGAVSTHNTSTSAHSDIRDLITALTTKLNNFLDVDDTTADQLSEVLTLIENNKGTLESLTSSKVNVSDVVNNLTTNVANKPLSAAQGVAIKALIDVLEDALADHEANTTKHITSTERTNWNAAKTHADSAHAPSNAEKNQNAFSNIKVGDTTVAADTATDTVTFVGSNVTITPDATNYKVTFSVADGSTSTKGLVQLTDSTSSTSTTTAATPNSVKSAYDLANTAKATADEKAVVGTAEVDDAVAGIKDVSAESAPYAKVLEIGGMTRKCTNLISFPYLSAGGTANGVTYTLNADGTITLVGKTTSGFTITLCEKTLPAGEYYLSDGCSVTGINFIAYDLNSSEVLSYEGAFTLPKSTKVRVYFLISDGFDGTVTVHPMLNSGDTALPYEPYFEGLRSAPVTEVESVGVNLIQKPSPETVSGVKVDVFNDGTITFDGTTIAAFNYTLFYGDLLAGSYYMSWDSSVTGLNLFVYDHLDGKVALSNDGVLTVATKRRFTIYATTSVVGDRVSGTIRPMLNKGDKKFPYSPYFHKIVPIPAEVQALDGYGWGTSDKVYNYIDFEKKQFVKWVERVDLGTLAWQLTNTAALITLNDMSLTPQWIASTMPSKIKQAAYDGTNPIFYLFFDDGAYTSFDQLREDLQGVMLYYEIKTPVITDISDILPDDNLIGVEGGGTVTMVNEYGYDVPNKIEFYKGNNDILGANKFVGDLEGAAKTISGLTSTIDELNQLDGITSNVQTQLDGKLSKSGGTMNGGITFTTTTTPLSFYGGIGCRTDMYGNFVGGKTATSWNLMDKNENPVFTVNWDTGDTIIKGSVTAAGGFKGNADSATKLVTPRTISLTGDIIGSVAFDGSANASIEATVADNSHNHIIDNIDGLQNVLDSKANFEQWDCTVTCATWSRLCHIACGISIEGAKFILNIAATRNSVVYNDTFIITAHHSGNGKIIKIAGSNYSTGYKIRLLSNSNGDAYVELYDDCNGATNSILEDVHCRLIPIFSGIITKYTTFTDGTNAPSGYNVVQTMTTTNDDLQGNLGGTARYAVYEANSGAPLIHTGNIGSQSVNYATSADSATKATQDASGNVITSTYATKTELGDKLSKSGGSMTGGIDFSSVTTPLAFGGTGGCKMDAYGNFIAGEIANTWNLMNKNENPVFTVNWDTGDTIIKGSVTASGGFKGNADTATKAIQDASGNTITSTYATKTELTNGLAGKANSSHSHITHSESSMSNTDLNTITTAGWYYGYTGMTNAPVQEIAVMEVLVYSGDWIIQRFTHIRSNGVPVHYVRERYNGTTWSAWQIMITSDNIGSQSVNYANSAGSASYATYDSSGNTITSTYATKTELTNGLAGKAPSYQYSTTDLTAGSSSLATGTLYFVYE